jgi:hypothetical protein
MVSSCSRTTDAQGARKDQNPNSTIEEAETQVLIRPAAVLDFVVFDANCDGLQESQTNRGIWFISMQGERR